jgi:hypothetical protein
MAFIRKYWPILTICLIEAVLFTLNYTPNTWLAGWDNLMPEFAPKINIVRSLTGIWQEHRGLGYADGMSHAAETLHVFCIWLLTSFLPVSLVRYVFVFFTHIIGGIGVYFCIRKLLPHHPNRQILMKVIPTLGALYYLFNYATIQTYAVPFEPFVIQFAVLPWLIFSLITYLEKQSKKTGILLFSMCILASAQYFVPTLFLGTTLLFFSLLLSFTILTKNRHWSLCLSVIFMYCVANFYWLVPYIATLPSTAPVIKNAKFNEMSSENVILNSQNRGSFLNVVTLRGYVLDTDMPNQQGIFGYFFTPIRTHADSLMGILAALIMPFFAILSFLHLSKKTNSHHLRTFIIGSLGATLVYIFFLGSTIPGISVIHESIRSAFPTISEAFRDPFTKFRIPLALCFTLLGSLGLDSMLRIQSKKISRLIISITIISTAYMSIPFLQGYFIHPYMRIAIPKTYERMFSFMKSQPDGRIATFPQTTFWSWRVTNYGYTGSGFSWYGLPQATMDRSFDPWSRENENYYWELTYAVYKKDSKLFSDVLKKYDISYILIDSSQKALFAQSMALYFDEISAMTQKIPGTKEIATFDSLHIYSIRNPEPNITTYESLPKVGPSYSYGDNDAAYSHVGNYISSPQDSDIYYPFRPLFSKRGNTYSGITFRDSPTELLLTADISTLSSNSYVIATKSSVLSIQEKSVTATIDKKTSIRFNAVAGQDFSAVSAVPCNINKDGRANVEDFPSLLSSWIRFSSYQGNSCLTLNATNLEQKYGYIVAVQNRHVSGKSLLLSIANMTARHTEIDEFFSTDTEWHTDYFILPALANDGLGYSLYFTNEAKGTKQTINDIKEIHIYEFPYEQLLQTAFVKKGYIEQNPSTAGHQPNIVVNHPNPAYYSTEVSHESIHTKQTLILNQSYNAGWIAFANGKILPNHTLINNWANGWELPQLSKGQTVRIFFLPQLLEWIGFALLPIPFFFILHKKR